MPRPISTTARVSADFVLVRATFVLHALEAGFNGPAAASHGDQLVHGGAAGRAVTHRWWEGSSPPKNGTADSWAAAQS